MNYKEIAQETLNIEAQTLLDAAQNIDGAFSKAIETILACKGKLIVTGVGKSGLAVAALLSCDKGWLVTANKMLQSQYILEFPWMADFRGRSNYSCQNSPGKNCANAGCQNSKGGRAACSKDWGCDYHTARSRAMNSPYTTMNLSALLIHSMYKTGKDTDFELRTPHQRPVLIIDEAHNLPEALTGVIEISISLEKLQKIGLMDIPDFHDPTHYIGFLKQVHELATDALEAEDVRPDVAKELEIIENQFDSDNFKNPLLCINSILETKELTKVCAFVEY